jgi:hypothetical protein
MVRIKLEDRFPNIIGLKEWEEPLHLLEDSDNIFYLISCWDYLTRRPENSPNNRIFIGNEDEEMNSVDKVIKIECYRDGGTTEIEFMKDSEKGTIYVPNVFEYDKGCPARLKFKGDEKELKKVGYTSAYLFNVL